MAKRSSIKTSKKDIVEYWSSRVYEGDMGVDFAEAHERCWRCGYQLPLQRCHIIPDSLGGADAPSNYVLLCNMCHREAPNVADARFMWIWIKATCVPFYDTYWSWRAQQDFEAMFGRKPFQNFNLTESYREDLQRSIDKQIEKAIHHFGDAKYNASSWACLYALIEEELLNQEIKTPEGENRRYLEDIGWLRRETNTE
jgi:hypothetical protein